MAHALEAARCHWALQRSSSCSRTCIGDCTRSATSGHGSKVPQNDAVKAFAKLSLLHKNPTKWVQVKYLTTMCSQVALTFQGHTQFRWADSHPRDQPQQASDYVLQVNHIKLHIAKQNSIPKKHQVLFILQDIFMNAELRFIDDTCPHIMGFLQHLICESIL